MSGYRGPNGCVISCATFLFIVDAYLKVRCVRLYFSCRVFNGDTHLFVTNCQVTEITRKTCGSRHRVIRFMLCRPT